MDDSTASQERLHGLAGDGLEQLQELLLVVRQMFTQLGYGQPGDAVQRQLALQTRYTQLISTLRSTLTDCSLLAAEGPQGGQAGSADSQDGTAESFEARFAHAEAELCIKNELLKQLIDQLRQMLESMCMWESQKHQLERFKLAEGH